MQFWNNESFRPCPEDLEAGSIKNIALRQIADGLGEPKAIAAWAAAEVERLRIIKAQRILRELEQAEAYQCELMKRSQL